MDQKFEEKMLRAKKNWRRKLYIPLVLGAITLLLAFIITIFLIATELRVHYEGPEAAFESKRQSGRGFFIGSKRFFLLDKKALIEISAPGYKMQPVHILADSGSNIVEVPLKLLKRNVEITSIPKPLRPTWRINGDYYSSDVVAKLALKPGDYTLHLQAANLQDYDAQITVPFGASSTHNITVTPHAITGHYKIVSQPAGAQVIMNDKPIGVSPINGTLPAEDVVLSVAMKGYQTVIDAVSAEELAAGLARNYVLEPGQRKIALSLKPSGGQLYLNAHKIPTRPEITIAKQGVSRITYMKEGYVSQSVTLQPSGDAISITLEPAYANLMVVSYPSATVTIDGVDYGKTPLETKMRVGRYMITLQKDGYSNVNKSVTLTQGMATKVEETLIRLSDLHGPMFTNSIGIELIRVKPKAFTMGAPRSEIGQRANEVQRRVTFDRLIYVSKYEITEAQYRHYNSKTSSSKKPITSVSWEQAALFCNWLSRQERLLPFYRVRSGKVVGYDAGSSGYRLPSEAEWEYIAKFHKKPKPTIFVWGDAYKVTESAGNIADQSASGATKKFIGDYNDGNAGVADVGSYKEEQSGFHDFSGNVSEWVHDAYILTPSSRREFRNYLGEGNSLKHVVKGSNYLSVSWQELRASFRETASNGRRDVGFRVARYIH